MAPTSEWDLSTLGPAQRLRVLGSFAIGYALLVYVGYVLKEHAGALTIIWPAAGLLFIALVSLPVRQWLWIIPLQLAAEVVVGSFQADGLELGWSLTFPVGNLCDAVVAAFLVKRWLPDPSLARLGQVAFVIVASAAGAAVGALVGASGASMVLEDASYLRQLQLWWAGNWLGTLVIAPVVMAWLVRWRLPHVAVVAGSRYERWILGFLIIGTTAWTFSSPPGSPSSILNLPFIPLALLVIAAFRLAPRWVFAFSTAAILLAAELASRGLGPFAGSPDPFGRVISLQIYLATVAAFTFMISVALLERSRLTVALTLSRERYRNFVARTSEAVWRVELRQGMPLDLPVIEQIEWLKANAYIAECNRAYRHFYDGQHIVGDEWDRWLADVPWATIYLKHIDEAARQEYSMDGLQFGLAGGEHWLASFSGVIEEDKLTRVWGVARNVTELVSLNDRLRMERERLRSYAQELTQAEEQARRSTAIDLHDGIGQMLVGLSMNLDSAARQAPMALQSLFDEMRMRVREILESTRRLIADLSPPGLYDLGLGPALDWLSTHVRRNDGLHIDLDVDIDESRLDVDLRILAFKVVRELLRNVVKHAGVKKAAVRVRSNSDQLSIEVRDDGVGFAADPTLHPGGTRGFGLWSITDRVRSAGGDMRIDAEPGKGCSALVVLPLAERRRTGTNSG